jgi:hypothetical protein
VRQAGVLVEREPLADARVIGPHDAYDRVLVDRFAAAARGKGGRYADMETLGD